MSTSPEPSGPGAGPPQTVTIPTEVLVNLLQVFRTVRWNEAHGYFGPGAASGTRTESASALEECVPGLAGAAERLPPNPDPIPLPRPPAALTVPVPVPVSPAARDDDRVPLLTVDGPPSGYTYRPTLRLVAVDDSTLQACRAIRGEARPTCAIVLAQLMYTIRRTERSTSANRRVVEDANGRWVKLLLHSWARWLCLGRKAIRRALDRLHAAGLVRLRTEGGAHSHLWVATELRLPAHVTDGAARNGARMYPVCGWIRDAVTQALTGARARPLAFLLLARLAFLNTRPRRNGKIPTRIERVDEFGRIWLALSTRSLAADLGVTQRRVRECLEELCAARLIACGLFRVGRSDRHTEQALQVVVAVPERDGL